MARKSQLEIFEADVVDSEDECTEQHIKWR